MNTKRKLAIISLILAMLLAAGTVFAIAADDSDLKDSSGNLFFSGTEKVVDGASFFGGYGAGKDLSIKNSKSKDSVAMAGMDLNVEGTRSGGSVYLAGKDITVNDTRAEGNLMIAGQTLKVDKDSSCNGAYLTGQSAVFAGTARAAGISASTIDFNGNVSGDVNLNAETVVIGKDAVVTGTLKVSSPKEPKIADGAKIGKLDFDKVESSSDESAAPTAGEKFLDGLVSAIYWAVAMIILGLLLFLIGRHHIQRAGSMIKTRPGKMLGSGAIALIAAPVAILLCFITIIGIPAAIFTGLVYTLCILVSTAFTGAALGSVVLKKMRLLPAGLLGIAALELVEAIPYLGTLVQIATILFTLGYLIQTIYLNRQNRKSQVEDMISTDTAQAEDMISTDHAQANDTINVDPVQPEVVINTDPAHTENTLSPADQHSLPETGSEQ